MTSTIKDLIATYDATPIWSLSAIKWKGMAEEFERAGLLEEACECYHHASVTARRVFFRDRMRAKADSLAKRLA